MNSQAILCDEARRYLGQLYLERIERALDVLPGEDLWWQPHPEALSVGTILVHLEGNVRQWILSGMGGEPDHRQRSAEFRAQARPSAVECFSRLRETCAQASACLEGIQSQDWSRKLTIQGYETTVAAAVLHVVEHFSWHTGQVVWIAKARAGNGHGLAFYDDAKLDGMRNG